MALGPFYWRFFNTYRDSSPLPREIRRSRLRGCEQRRHIWRWMQTNRVIQMIIINDTIFLCTTTTAWSDAKMSRDAFSGAKVPEVYDDSVATTLKVIMDVLKVKSYFRENWISTSSVRPALFYIIIITAFQITITFLVIVCRLQFFLCLNLSLSDRERGTWSRFKFRPRSNVREPLRVDLVYIPILFTLLQNMPFAQIEFVYMFYYHEFLFFK